MAQSKNNPVTRGLSGKFGDALVFRQRGGKTFISKIPAPVSQPASAAQQALRNRFRQAIQYGRAAIADPVSKAAYQAAAKNGQTAFNVAVSDFYHAPTIHEVDLTGYTGAPGSTIAIRATDDFAIASVTVRLESDSGTLLEEGAAYGLPGGTWYTYTVTTGLPVSAGYTILVTAADRAGNRTTQKTKR